MKPSYLLSILVANLRNIIKVIQDSKHDKFVVDLVIDNYRNTYDLLRSVTNKDDVDVFVTADFYKHYFAKKMDYIAERHFQFTKIQYIAEVKAMIDKTIDNAARKGFCIESDTEEASTPQPVPTASDDTPDGNEMLPPQISEADSVKILKLLQNISNNMQKVAEIIERALSKQV